jgi:hypothetical protein
MWSKLRIAKIVGAFLVLAAGISQPASAAPDPCSLLTPAQVSAALGVTVGAGQSLGAAGCYWRGSGQAADKKVSISILTMQGFAIGKTPVPDTEKPPVSGIGDEAYYKYFAEPRYDKIKVVDLDVKKGNTAFGIGVSGFPVEESKAKAKTLALQVLPKL